MHSTIGLSRVLPLIRLLVEIGEKIFNLLDLKQLCGLVVLGLQPCREA